MSLSRCAVLTLVSVLCWTGLARAAEQSAMQVYVQKLTPGWNLGNTLDATGDETSWGNPATTKELIDRIAADGFKSIRIPTTWGHRMGPGPEYKIRPEFMQRVKQIVDWSLASGMNVMLNMHHDSGWVEKMVENPDEVSARFDATWRQIASEFKDYPNTLMLEGINEPKFSSDWGKDEPQYYQSLRRLNDSFVKIVRESGGNNATRPLVLSTLAASSTQKRLDALYETITSYKDTNLIATVHYYGYWPFSVNIAGATTFNKAAQDDIEQTFERAHTTLVTKGIPVIVGEYGLLGFDKSVNVVQHGEILKFFESVGHHSKRTGMPLMWWDNGQHLDRREMKWRDPQLLAVIMAGVNGRSSTADRDSVYLKAEEEAKDVAMPLNLHGNIFKALKAEERELARGTDYQLDGDVLTLKASLLKSFAKTELGRVGSMTCEFSSGAPWVIHVVRYQTPELRAAEGQSSAFHIPVEFNGDSLATMEARYADGTNAGPANWTPFKEFHNVFRPDYELGTIQLMPGFFRDMKDGEVLLTFHFWSGEKLPYTITKEGNKVLGAPEK